MYNEKQKKDFIRYYNNGNDTYITCLFNYTADADELKDKDVSCFREKEIYELLSGMNSVSVDTLNVKLSILRTYTTWCEKRGLLSTNMNCYNSIARSDMVHCINTVAKEARIIDRETMLKYCDELVNPADKLLVMCIFEGVKTKRSVSALGGLKREDVHPDYIQLEDRRVKISPKLYEMVQETNETDDYFPMFGTEKEISIKLAESIFVFRPKNSSKYPDDAVRNTTRLKSRFTKYISTYTNPNLTITSLYWSGIIYNLNEIAKKKKLGLSQAMYTAEFDEIIEQYGLHITKANILRKVKTYTN